MSVVCEQLQEIIERVDAARPALSFELPPDLEASAPPEARGLARDGVRLMVSQRSDDSVEHATFRDITNYLDPGDLVVINTSGTMNAALDATAPDGRAFELHLSTHLPGNLWVVEMRQPSPSGTKPYFDVQAGDLLRLPAGGEATLLVPYSLDGSDTPGVGGRLWIATLQLPEPLREYLDEHGFPIRYGYVRERWPSSYYQTVYAAEPGSAEMPSAGRAFTPEIITALVARGVQVAPLILHTGVSSLEEHEPPYEEYYRVPAATARAVNATHASGGRVIAVGTTVVRALETVTEPEGVAHAGEGWTRVIITPERGVRAVDGLLTGLHEPRATHLSMLEAIASCHHLAITYAEALRERYLWHEFGDLHLLLP